MSIKPNIKESTIWVDADACPVPVREVILKAVRKNGIPTFFVANTSLPIKKNPYAQIIVVSSGFDVADGYIVEKATEGDLVVTSDIHLASEVLNKGCHAINTKGTAFSPETIKQKLNMRDFLETMRGSGIHSGGSAPYSAKDKQQFANALNAWITQL